MTRKKVAYSPSPKLTYVDGRPLAKGDGVTYRGKLATVSHVDVRRRQICIMPSDDSRDGNPVSVTVGEIGAAWRFSL